MEPTEPIQVKHTEYTPATLKQEHELSDSERFSRDLDDMNVVIVEMLQDKNTDASALKQAWLVRAIHIENFIDSLVPSETNANPRAEAMFDAMVDKALIFQTVGDTVRYLEELDSAEIFAITSNLDGVTSSIGKELDEQIEHLGSSPKELILKLRGRITYENREYLRDLVEEGIDENDFVGDIQGMILDEDGDPDEVIRRIGLTE